MESFNADIALSGRGAASALLDVQKALRPFHIERVVAATSVTDMDLRALKRRPISIWPFSDPHISIEIVCALGPRRSRQAVRPERRCPLLGGGVKRANGVSVMASDSQSTSDSLPGYVGRGP